MTASAHPLAPHLVLCILLTVGCGANPAPRDPDSAVPTRAEGSFRRLLIQLADHDFDQNRSVLDAIVRSRFAYFRFVAIPWSQATCDAFASVLNRFPVVNLHGDAHVEQYTVVSDAHGLDDFDRATTGPAVLDLTRFAGSVYLAATLKGWQDSDAIVAQFLDAYLEAVEDPNASAPTPGLVGRLRRRDASPEQFLAWAESLMEPLNEADSRAVDQALGVFAASMAGQHEQHRDGYYTPQRFGRLRMGVGSGLVAKFLVRIAGPTDEPEDDLIVEFKEIQPEQPSCAASDAAGVMLRPVVGRARIGRGQNPVLGFIPVIPESDYTGNPFWGRSWDPGYREVALADLADRTDLVELSRDVGYQLGHGHVRDIAEPVTPQLRTALRYAVERTREDIVELSRRLAADVSASFDEFRLGVGPVDPEVDYR